MSGLPVEIYRKELVDTGSKDENKPTSDSFNVDEATDFINFFVYIYDRKERNIEKGMRLVAPNRHEFSTSSELRAEYHQISIVGNLTGYGSWSYNIKRFCCNPQPHFVQILAYPKLHSSDFIRAKAFIRRPRKGGPQIVYAQVMQGKLPIVDALVEMSVKHNGQKITTAQLFDNGSGDPDVTRGDGIYSRYFAISEPGMYTFQLFVSDNGNVAYVKGSLDDQPGKKKFVVFNVKLKFFFFLNFSHREHNSNLLWKRHSNIFEANCCVISTLFNSFDSFYQC